MSAGSTKAGRRPAPLRVRNRGWADGPLVGEDRVRRADSVDGLVPFPDPVEPCRTVARIADGPGRPRRQIGETAAAQPMLLAAESDGERSLGDEQRGLGPGIRLGPVAAAARADLHDRAARRFGEAGQRARDDPGPWSLPSPGGGSADDIRERAAGNDRVRLGEDGAGRWSARSAPASRRAGRNRRSAIRSTPSFPVPGSKVGRGGRDCQCRYSGDLIQSGMTTPPAGTKIVDNPTIDK